MKKIFLALAAFAIVVMAAYSFTGTKNAAPSTGTYLPFKTISTDTSGSNRVATINCNFFTDGNYYMAASDSITLTLQNVKNGGNYRLLIKKTVSGVCTLTTSATVVGTTSPISLSGSTNSYFWVDFTADGSVTVLHKR